MKRCLHKAENDGSQVLGMHGTYKTWTRWGRVGEHGQNAVLGDNSLDDAIRQFEKKFKDKSGHTWANRLDQPKKNKYTFLERNYEQDSSEDEQDLPRADARRDSKTSLGSENNKAIVESSLPKPVQRLMQLIFNQAYFDTTMMEMSYDANKLPLGKLSKRTLKAGFERLKELAELLTNPALADERHNMPFADAVMELTNSYYTVIPHSFGRNRPPMISSDETLKKEVELLESLSDMEIANEIMKDANISDEMGNVAHPLDRQYAGLGMQEMTPRKYPCDLAKIGTYLEQWTIPQTSSSSFETTSSSRTGTLIIFNSRHGLEVRYNRLS